MTHTTRRMFLGSAAAGLLHRSSSGQTAENQSAPIKVGQIGTRHAHAAGKMDTFRKFPELFEVVGVVEPDSAQRQRLSDSATYSGLQWLSEEDLLQVDGLQGVAVETEIDDLLATARRCLESGLHVHLDKPAGVSLPHFHEICKIADEKHLMIQMGYMFRSNPAFRFLYAAVRKGWIGEVFQVHCEMSKKVNDSSRVFLARYRGGAMFELGCHLIDAVVTVLGKPTDVHTFHRNTRANHDNLMDNCLAVLEYPSAIATVKSSVSEVEGGRRRQFVVCGTKGTIVINPLEPHQLRLTLESATAEFRKGTTDVELPRSTGRYDGDMQHFARVIRGVEKPEYNTKHDLAVQETVLRASDMLPRG